ncbi:hypothetical protein GCM10027262_14460 [Nocardia tengchongensis]
MSTAADPVLPPAPVPFVAPAPTTPAAQPSVAPEPVPAPAPAPPPAAAPAPQTTSAPSVYYGSCAEAKRAGAAPIRRGEPGYRSGLDRDGDGIACEK